ncbi:MAG TPA: sigma-54 dependent transcriptional regulator [Candidatus Binatia bacterium]|nr:sigma-54 dependent transcriptional regulator [Candidatus Binatia bacterium]
MNQVLVVDDEAPMRAALEATFRRDGWEVATAMHAQDALTKFRAAPTPLVISDMRMPGGDGLSVLHGVREMAPHVAVIFLTAFATVPEAVEAMREGACDYLVKPVSFDRLKETARRALARPPAQVPGPSVRTGCGALVGSSPALARAVERARRIAATDMDVLIEAESGSGKELLARLIHSASDRRTQPFLAVNCAAFPEALLESELFGHARGAFTGAFSAKLGKFEAAHRGTLLLDEIGELPLSLQPKLLRVLQEREVDRLGETRPVRVDVRVVATTNQPLQSLVQAGKFRADLYYRLKVAPLSLPPLRERREDIRELAEHFIEKHAPARGVRPRISAGLLSRLEQHGWPGNVRELENFVRHALAFSRGPELSQEDWEECPPPEPAGEPPAPPAGQTLREMERSLLESTLAAQGGNRTRAARQLGICPRTMRNKIREYGLPPRRPM